MIIRIVTANDAEYGHVWQLREAVLRQPIGLSLKNEDLSGEVNETTFAAIDEGRVVGCLMLKHVSDEEIKFRQMAVAEGMQGKGVGRKLMEAAEVWAWENGYHKISLHARITAEGFYAGLGYAAIGDVFEEVGIPHILMEKRKP